GQGLVPQEQLADPLAPVVRLVAARLARPARQGLLDLGDQLLTGLVQAHLRVVRVIRQLVQVQHVLHLADELAAAIRRDAPASLLPGLQRVFLSTWRTCSWEIDSTRSSSTNLPASSRSVQRRRPAGGSEQASATRCAS